jgi:hypothetical protein
MSPNDVFIEFLSLKSKSKFDYGYNLVSSCNGLLYNLIKFIPTMKYSFSPAWSFAGKHKSTMSLIQLKKARKHLDPQPIHQIKWDQVLLPHGSNQ